jgi:hypothetical protein
MHYLDPNTDMGYFELYISTKIRRKYITLFNWNSLENYKAYSYWDTYFDVIYWYTPFTLMDWQQYLTPRWYFKFPLYMYIPVLWNQYTVDGHYIHYKDNSWFRVALIHIVTLGMEALFQATMPSSPTLLRRKRPRLPEIVDKVLRILCEDKCGWN